MEKGLTIGLIVIGILILVGIFILGFFGKYQKDYVLTYRYNPELNAIEKVTISYIGKHSIGMPFTSSDSIECFSPRTKLKFKEDAQMITSNCSYEVNENGYRVGFCFYKISTEYQVFDKEFLINYPDNAENLGAYDFIKSHGGEVCIQSPGSILRLAKEDYYPYYVYSLA